MIVLIINVIYVCFWAVVASLILKIGLDAAMTSVKYNLYIMLFVTFSSVIFLFNLKEIFKRPFSFVAFITILTSGSVVLPMGLALVRAICIMGGNSGSAC